jgi:MFS family permease
LNIPPANSLAGRTFRLDLLRAIPSGVLETLWTTFAVLIAVRYFELSPTSKAALVASSSAGYLGSLFIVSLAALRGWRAPKVAGVLWGLAAAAMAVVAITPPLAPVFLGSLMLAAFLPPLSIPLMAQALNANYGADQRGKLFSLASMARMSTAMLAALAIGAWLDRGLGRFPWLFGVYAACASAVAICLWRVECPPVEAKSTRWLAAFGHARRDRAFAKLLCVWMLIGLGNLISVAIYVEFAANPAHGLQLSSAMVGGLTSTLPTVFALFSILIWGRMFDRRHFYRVRGLINLLFMVSTLCYFGGGTLPWMALGMAAHGLARAGGDVSWNLWVTKFARPDQIAEYMSVHAFLTGLRGLVAPFIGFHLLAQFPPHVVAAICATLILAGTALILPEILDTSRKHGRNNT